MGEGLRTNWSLEQLDLTNNIVGADGARALGDSLRTNATLKQLNLTANRVGDDEEIQALQVTHGPSRVLSE